MKPTPFFDHIRIDEFSITPKYIQLANSVLSAIETGKIGNNDQLPSINEISYVLEVSRDTAEKGYKRLKELGALGSVPGKGYYVLNTEFKQKLHVVLFFNKLSAHKKIIYDAFIQAIGNDVSVDFYIYNNDFALFKKLLLNPKHEYTHYVIIPHFFAEKGKEAELVKTVQKESHTLLNKKFKGANAT